jgi:hypothetical protein
LEPFQSAITVIKTHAEVSFAHGMKYILEASSLGTSMWV